MSDHKFHSKWPSWFLSGQPGFLTHWTLEKATSLEYDPKVFCVLCTESRCLKHSKKALVAF